MSKFIFWGIFICGFCLGAPCGMMIDMALDKLKDRMIAKATGYAKVWRKVSHE